MERMDSSSSLEEEEVLSDDALENLRTSWKYQYRTEEERMDVFRNDFKQYWANRVSNYDDQTTMSSMVGTFKPMSDARPCASLQFYSIKLVRIEESLLSWPLQVYGIVAVRDQLDHNRNIVFQRQREHCQTITPKDSFLEMTGPCRAIKFNGDSIYIEIQLRVRKDPSAGTDESCSSNKDRDDEALISQVFDCNDRSICLSTRANKFCELKLNIKQLHNTVQATSLSTRANKFCELKLNIKQLHNTVQATIVGIRVQQVADDDVDSSSSTWWPRQYGGRVVARTASRKTGFVLLDSRTWPLLQHHSGSDPDEGYLDLSRRVVSVEIGGQLIISVEAYSLLPSFGQDKGKKLGVGTAVLTPNKSGISQATCQLLISGTASAAVCNGNKTSCSWNVEIIVAWSLIAPISSRLRKRA